VQAGDLTQAEAENHPWRNRITRSLGVAEMVKLDTQSLELKVGDVLVLCSDGLIRHVKDAEIGTMVSDNLPATAAEQLIQLANSRGGSDNISALVVRVQLEDLAPTERAVAAPVLAPVAAPTGPAPLSQTTPLSQAASLAQPAPAVAESRRRPWALYIGVGGVLALIVLGAVTFAATRLMRGSAADSTAVATTTTVATAAVAATATPLAEATATVQPVAQVAAPTAASPSPSEALATATAIATDGPGALATAISEIEGTVIVGVGVFLRVEPSVDAQVVSLLEMGTSFLVISWSQQERGQCDSGIWLDVVLADSTSGWLCGDSRFVRIMDRPVSVELLDQLGVPVAESTEAAPTATAAPKNKTEAPAPLIDVSFPASLPRVQLAPLVLPTIAPLDLTALACARLSPSWPDFGSLSFMTLPALSLPTVAPPCAVDVSRLRLCCPS
ncbi:MAG: hypothetical protein ACYC5O_16705, partial [Anaerolineae bacterium]